MTCLVFFAAFPQLSPAPARIGREFATSTVGRRDILHTYFTYFTYFTSFAFIHSLLSWSALRVHSSCQPNHGGCVRLQVLWQASPSAGNETGRKDWAWLTRETSGQKSAEHHWHWNPFNHPTSHCHRQNGCDSSSQ